MGKVFLSNAAIATPKFWPTVNRIDDVFEDRNLIFHVLQYLLLNTS